MSKVVNTLQNCSTMEYTIVVEKILDSPSPLQLKKGFQLATLRFKMIKALLVLSPWE